VAAFKLSIRRTGRTEHSRFGTLEEALAALEARLDELAPLERRGTERALVREFRPEQQVVARGEIAAPGGLHGGVDLHGDASAEAFTGRWRRVALAPAPGETAYDALRRALTRA
jgi:hypothetical protein